MLSITDKEMFDDIVNPALANVSMIEMLLDGKPVSVVGMYRAMGVSDKGIGMEFFPFYITVNDDIADRLSHKEEVDELEAYHGKSKTMDGDIPEDK